MRWLCLLLIGLIIISGCVSEKQTTTTVFKTTTTSLGLERCNNISFDFFRYRCYSEVAAEKGDTSICENISLEEYGESIKAECYLEVARKNNNISICRNMSDDWYKECCKQVAIESENISICDYIGEEFLLHYNCILFFKDKVDASIFKKYKVCINDSDCERDWVVTLEYECINKEFTNTSGIKYVPAAAVAGPFWECRCRNNTCISIIYNKKFERCVRDAIDSDIPGCFIQFAIDQKDPSLCDKMLTRFNNQKLYDTCLQKVAK
jgi:hypothetical protein